MCRFVAYIGKPLVIDDILFKPENSLINQSYHAKEASEPLNGDGFGIGWYTHQIDLEPGLFTSIQPAWNNRNLKYLAKKWLTCLDIRAQHRSFSRLRRPPLKSSWLTRGS